MSKAKNNPQTPAAGVASQILARLQEMEPEDENLKQAKSIMQSEQFKTIVVNVTNDIYAQLKEELEMNANVPAAAPATAQPQVNATQAPVQPQQQPAAPVQADSNTAEQTETTPAQNGDANVKVVYLDKPMSTGKKIAIAGGFVAAGVAGFILGNKFGDKLTGAWNSKFGARSQIGTISDAPALPEASGPATAMADDAIEMTI